MHDWISPPSQLSLPSQSEVMASWEGGSSAPRVSVLCNTYNHRAYLPQALRGFLIQKTSFPFEVILHDDASTDGTSDLVRDYAQRYPALIKPVIRPVNLYSQGARPTLLSLEHAGASLIALCEGDDYWIDESKLARQVAALDTHPQVNLCFHPAWQIDGDGEFRGVLARHYWKPAVIPLERIVSGGGGYCPTGSLLLRRKIFGRLGDWFSKTPAGDYFIQIAAALGNGAVYLPDVMSVYRRAITGSWSSRHEDMEILAGFERRMLDALNAIDQSGDRELAALSDKILANTYYFLALSHLRASSEAGFRKYIARSWKHQPFLTRGQTVFYLSRHFQSMLRRVGVRCAG